MATNAQVARDVAGALARGALSGGAAYVGLEYVRAVADVYDKITQKHAQDDLAEATEDPVMDELVVREYAGDCGSSEVVGKDEFDAALASLKADYDASGGWGMFTGPNDPAINLFREAGVSGVGLRAVVLQVMHPFVAVGVLTHSNVLTNPLDRAEKTQRYVTAMLYGNWTEIERAARAVRGLHSKVKGSMDENVGVFSAASKFDAAERHAIRWVAATMPDAVQFGSEIVLGKSLNEAEKQAVIDVNLKFMKAFGLAGNDLPRDWAGYERWYNAVLRSNVLAVGTSTKALVETLSIPPHPMLWWVTAIQRWLNYQLVPGRVAEAVYGRRFTAIDRLGFALIFALIRVQYKLLPEWVRFVTPYHVMVQRLVAPYSPLRSFLVNTVATVAHSLMVAFLQPRDPQVVKEVLERAKIDVGKIKWGA